MFLLYKWEKKLYFVQICKQTKNIKTSLALFHGSFNTRKKACVFISWFFVLFFSVRLLSVLHGHWVFFIPAKTANDLRHRRIFYLRFYPLHLFTYLNSWERASIFPFECSVLNKGSTGTIFITSLVCLPVTFVQTINAMIETYSTCVFKDDTNVWQKLLITYINKETSFYKKTNSKF